MNLSLFTQLSKRNWFFWLLTCFMVCLPFFFVRYVPATDLPQHLGQIKLFIEHFSHPKAMQEYSINWSGANSLVYILLGIDWFVFSPIAAGKVLMLELVCMWVLAVFILAKRQHRTVESAVLASILVFNASFYWGFINFIIGFPVFIGWYLYVVDQSEEQKSTHHIIMVILFSVLLFLAHAIWLVVGIVYLGIEDLRRHRTFQHIIRDSIALVPILMYSFLWYIGFSTMRSSLQFDIAPHWYTLPYDRLNPKWLIDAILGGLHGPLELLVLIGIGAWCYIALFTNRGNIRTGIHFNFLWTGLFFTAIGFFAPDKYMNTISFASRWMPIALTFFLLALPEPKIPSIYRTTFPLLFATIFFCTTGFLWFEFENLENAGLTEALDAIPDQASVLGLDYMKGSVIICGRPYMQTFAYAQVLHNSKINFSFAEHQNGIIITNTKNPWTQGLEWMAEDVRAEDCQAFDYALINALDVFHSFISSPAMPILKPIITTGQWRLYKCQHNVQYKGRLFMVN